MLYCIDRKFVRVAAVAIRSGFSSDVRKQLKDAGFEFSVLYWGCEEDKDDPDSDWASRESDHSWDIEFFSHPLGWSDEKVAAELQQIGFQSSPAKEFRCHMTPNYTEDETERERAAQGVLQIV